MPTRTLLVLGLALAGGLSASVGIAWLRASLWGMGWRGNDWVSYHGSDTGIVGGYPVSPLGAFSVTELRTTASTDRIVRWVEPRWASDPPYERPLPDWSIVHDGPPDEMDRPYAVERAYGWPLRCVRVSWGFCQEDASFPGEAMRGGVLIEEVMWGKTSVHGSVQPDLNRIRIEERRALPLVPIWSGLAANAVVLSTPWLVLVVLLATPGTFVRWRRRRRGRCVACDYPCPEGAVVEPDRCPECGLAYGTHVPAWGWRSLTLLVLLVGASWATTLGFGIWRAVEREPLPATHLAAVEDDGEAIRRQAALGLPIDEELTRGVWTIGYLLSQGRPLAWAATRGSTDAVSALIEAGADVDADRGLALQRAAQRGHADACRLLLRAGADPRLEARNRGSALSYALGSGDARTIATFVELAQPSDEWLLAAYVHTSQDMLESHLGSREWSDDQLESAVLGAAKSGRVESLRTLLAHGALPDSWEHLLLAAVESGSAEAVAVLVDAGASTTNDASRAPTWTSLAAAVQRGDATMVELVLQAGGDPGAFGYPGETAMHVAARTAPIEVVDLLISTGTPLNQAPRSAGTPLMCAVEYRRLDVIERLLGAGADPAVRNAQGRTALEIARGYETEYVTVRPAPPEIIRALEEAMEAF
ncbi:MAG: ankyrin repeat domain-containing protein [Phycisphaerales bacterium]